MSLPKDPQEVLYTAYTSYSSPKLIFCFGKSSIYMQLLGVNLSEGSPAPRPLSGRPELL